MTRQYTNEFKAQVLKEVQEVGNAALVARRMEAADLTRSMSKKGCSPDNAACEGFFGIVKSEMFYTRSWDGVSVEEFVTELDSYIRWSNVERIKLSLGGKSPIA